MTDTSKTSFKFRMSEEELTKFVKETLEIVTLFKLSNRQFETEYAKFREAKKKLKLFNQKLDRELAKFEYLLKLSEGSKTSDSDEKDPTFKYPKA